MSDEDAPQQGIGMTRDHIEARLDSIEDKLDKLIITVRGNDEYGSTGIAPRVNELERRVNRLERVMDRAAWIAVGLGAAGAGVAEIVKALLGA